MAHPCCSGINPEGLPLTQSDLPDTALTDLGWSPFFSQQISDEEAQRCQPVRVMAVHRGMVAVAGDGVERLVSSYLPVTKGQVQGAEDNRPTAGDWLLIDRTSHEPQRLLTRTSLFKRRAPGDDHRHQLIAANVDTLFIVASCNQDFNIARLERYLVLAREAGVEPVIVLTKIDLTDSLDQFRDAARALQPGLPVECVNGRDTASVARLAAWCGKGQTVALLGSSGVGKSTMLNTMLGSDSILTQAVRAQDGKGRHTTTVRQMHRLNQGGWLMDTPGMREFQMTEAATGLAEVFDDIVDLTLECRFTNCAHHAEPGCAIQAALQQGTLEPDRLARWRKLTAEDTVTTNPVFEKRSRARKPARRT